MGWGPVLRAQSCRPSGGHADDGGPHRRALGSIEGGGDVIRFPPLSSHLREGSQQT